MRFVSIARRQRAAHPVEQDAETIGYEDFRTLPAADLRARLAGDARDAARWARAGARHGFPEAQLMLGQMLLDGAGVARDPLAALRWFRHAADAGLAEAMNMLGRCHELGWGAAMDLTMAAHWYRRAAERDHDWGQFNLANLLLRGAGVARDRGAALAWYRRAAAQGHAKSMNLIGRFLEEGWEVQPDPARAAAWYQRAAEAGDFRGQFNHAVIRAGLGFLAEARGWFQAAIAAGSPDFLEAAGAYLLARPETELRVLGHAALARRAKAGPDTLSWPATMPEISSGARDTRSCE